MSTYSKSQTQNSGSLGEAIEGEKLFTITNSKDPTDTYSVGYFTLDGNATSNQNLSSNAPMGGIFSDFTGGVNPNSLIQTNTRFSISIYGSGGSFKFTPSTPILVNSYYVKSVGEFDIEMAASSQPIVEEFIFKIDTSLGDGLNEFKFTPIVSGAGDFDIDFGDGNVFTNITSQTDSRLDHTYSTGGIYSIKVLTRSNLTNYNLYGSPDKLKWIDVVNWGTNSTLTNYSNLFYGANSLTSISATDIPDLSNVTTFVGMLRSSAINYDFSLWDFTNGTSFTFFALSATAINSSIGGNNFSNMTAAPSFYQGVTTNTSSLVNLTLGGNVSYFFYNTSNFSFNTLTNVDFSNVTNATGLFQNSDLTDTDYRNFLTDLTGWNGATATKTLQSNVPIHFGTAKYENGGTSEDIRNYLTSTKGWTITDGGGI